MAERSERTNIQLIIDKEDILIKKFVAGYWKGPNNLSGLSFTSPYAIQGVSAKFLNKYEMKTELSADKHTVNLLFPTPIRDL